MPLSVVPTPEPDSYIGDKPKCDICQQPVIEGQYVLQSYHGPVVRGSETGTLGIREQSYSLFHESCSVAQLESLGIK